MAVAENGRPTEHIKEKPNGHLNGHISGGAISPAAKRDNVPRSNRRRQSWSFWIFNNFARLTIWYALLTVVFRCPSSPDRLSDSSPQICKPYFSTKEYLQPHLEPYYKTYAEPYLDVARPYADLANRHVIRPASAVAKVNYEIYAADRIHSAQAYGQSQWNAVIIPRLHLAQTQAASIYRANLAPYVDQITRVLGPYYISIRDNTRHAYHEYLLPSYDYSKPYLLDAYRDSQDFVLNTAYPFARHTWSDLVIFFDGTFWPLLKGLYIDNVRPQLVMINERIVKYQESRKLRAVIDQVDTTSVVTTSASPTGTSPTTAVLDDVYAMFETDDDDSTLTTTETGPPSSTVQAPVRPPKETVTEQQISDDLINWQKKFAVAADKGSDDLRERVEEIIHSLVKSDLDGIGKGLANALEKTTINEIENVKLKIRSVVASVPDDVSADDIRKAAEDILSTIRASGIEIKDRAKKLREWEQAFEKGLIQRLATASASTLEVLDGIKDLGLQEVGLRWAWMEGVTYKHWAKYHAVRKQLDEWKQEVSNVALQHPDADKAIVDAQQILEDGMAITEDAAKELIRLKAVAQWKLRARDATDDFESRVVPAEAYSAASSLVVELQGAPSLAFDAANTLVSHASDATSGVVSAASSAIMGSSTGVLESAASEVSEFAEAVFATASSVLDVSPTDASDTPLSQDTSAPKVIYASGASAILDTSTGSLEALSAKGSEARDGISETIRDSSVSILSSITSFASSFADGSGSHSSNVAASASDRLEEAFESVSSQVDAVTSQAASVFAGALAQDVRGSIPILDDIFDESESDTYSERLQQVVNDAGDRYAQVTRAVSEAIYGTKQGTIESVTSVASEQYASALAAASSALLAAPQGPGESVASVASEAYQSAVGAASSVIFGTPAPITKSILQQASSLYSDALSRAEEHYSAAKSIASQQISGTPKPIHEQMFASIESAYSGAQQVASSRFDIARSAAQQQYGTVSQVLSDALPTGNPLDSVTAVAASVLHDSLVAASAQFSKAQVAVGVTTAPAHQRYLAEAQKNYYAAVGLAHQQYEDFISAASTAIYGEPAPILSSIANVASVAAYGAPEPMYQSLINAAASRYSSASAAASSSLSVYRSSLSSVANPPQSLLEDASSAYLNALGIASSSLSAASYAASTAIYGTPAPMYQSALDAASSRYQVASSAADANFAALLESASAAVGTKIKSPAQSVLDAISSQYNAAISAASSSLIHASSSASSAIYGAPTGSPESIASVASQNWEILVARASDRVYGSSKPFYEQYATQVEELSAHATEFAHDQYIVIQSFVSELIVGKQPAFTESALSRLSSAFYTGYHRELASSASSYASEAYDSASSLGSSVSSAAATFFTPPPEVSSILDSVTEQLNEIVLAASAQVYGTTKGPLEAASSVVAHSYSSASSVISEGIYGTQVGYAEAAQSSLAGVAQDAHEAISQAIYGPSKGAVESATSVAADTFGSVSSVVAANLAAAATVASDLSGEAASLVDTVKARVSDAIYEPEQKALESAQSRISEAVESAKSAIAAMASGVGQSGAEAAEAFSSSIEIMASAISSSVSSATSYVKDEL